MAQIRVIAFHMHEYEQAAANQFLRDAEHTAGFSLGMIEEEDISALQEQGVIVQVVEEPSPDGETGRIPGMGCVGQVTCSLSGMSHRSTRSRAMCIASGCADPSCRIGSPS